MDKLFSIFLTLVLSVASWSAPQPRYSSGLLVTYGNQRLVESNANWRSYDLSIYPRRCGFSAISPAMLGKIAWIRTAGHGWVGPCVDVDSVGRDSAYESIYIRHEIAEVPRWMAEELGFSYGAQGYIFFGQCPPPNIPIQSYRPPLSFDWNGDEITPSFYPYSSQEIPSVCNDSRFYRGGP